MHSVFSMNAFSDSANFLRPIDAVDNTPKVPVRSSGHLSQSINSVSGQLEAHENQNNLFIDPKNLSFTDGGAGTGQLE